MKTMFVECNMGAAGDMLMSALMDLLPEHDEFIEEMNSLGIPGVEVSKETIVSCGIAGPHITVRYNNEEEKSHDVMRGYIVDNEVAPAHKEEYCEVEYHPPTSRRQTTTHFIQALPISAQVKANALNICTLILEAESAVHGETVTEVHSNLLGSMDAVADIVGVCLLMEKLDPQHIVVSPVHVGRGQIKCRCGILPVPAPATAHILKGIPYYSGDIDGELCTPTGAALLKFFATEFGEQPMMVTNSIGYGMGKKDFPIADCVRIFLGE